MEDYQIRLRRHLSEYKLSRLGISEEGIWRRNGKRYPHILPESHRVENLLETYRADLDAYIERTSTLERHRDFHHLNSSQAMCLNLFYPFFAAPEADSLSPLIPTASTSKRKALSRSCLVIRLLPRFVTRFPS